MFLRETTRKNKDGSTVSYLQLALSEWDKQRRRPVTKIIYSFPLLSQRLSPETL